jgi:hypothetical protein
VITGPQIPATVILPSTRTMTAAAVQSALNASKQTISYYRCRHNFPAAEYRGPRSIMRTADVAAFVTAHGSKVQWS